MRITACGHATLYIETGDQRIFVDPVFESELVDGAVQFSPARTFDQARLPVPTALVITHGHFDHFVPASLRRFDTGLPIYTSEDVELIAALRELGFARITALRPFEELCIGDLRVCPTPSGHGEPEVGLLFADDSGTFWHMADGEVTPRIGRRLLHRYGSVDVISAKYQPVVRASMGYLRNRGAAFDKEEVINWLETACRCEPRLVFPYASGLCFGGRHAWFNRYALPLSPDETVALLRRRLGEARAAVVAPGDVVTLAGPGRVGVEQQASPFVAAIAAAPIAWEPVDVATLDGLGDAAARAALRVELEKQLRGDWLRWLRAEAGNRDSLWSAYVDNQVVWQLVVHAGGGERLCYHVDLRDVGAIETRAGLSGDANAFTHLGGATLAEVLAGRTTAALFWLAGQARSFEKIIVVRDGRLHAPAGRRTPQNEMADPLTYYLRHAADGSIPALHADHDERAGREAQRDAVGQLLRAGELDRRDVAQLAVTLAQLALGEGGGDIDPSAVQAESDGFRARVGLVDEDETRRWLDDASLDVERYSRLLAGIVAARARAVQPERMQEGERWAAALALLE